MVGPKFGIHTGFRLRWAGIWLLGFDVGISKP
jgi:hypothetical protein